MTTLKTDSMASAHERALEAAGNLYAHRPATIEELCVSYLTTLLDSPEVRDAVARGIGDSQSPSPTMGEKWPNGIPTPYLRLAQAALSTIKTQAGIDV